MDHFAAAGMIYFQPTVKVVCCTFGERGNIIAVFNKFSHEYNIFRNITEEYRNRSLCFFPAGRRTIAARIGYTCQSM
jgi:hypothetical protein